MEATGTPTPEPDRPRPPAEPPPPAAPGQTGDTEGRAGGGWRVLAVVLAIALVFAAAVMVIAMLDIGDTPTCDDVLSGKVAPPSDNECFDGSSGQKTASLILGWPSGVLAGIAALVALFFAATGGRGRLLLQLTGAAILLGALSIIIGSI